MTAPQRTAGDQREDAALLVGSAVAVIMSALGLALIGLIGPAVLKVLAGQNARMVGRRLHVEASALVNEATQHTESVIAEAQRQIVEHTTETVTAVLPPASSGPPAPSVVGSASVAAHFGRIPPPAPSGPLPVGARPPLALMPGPSTTLTDVAQSVRDAGLNALRETDDAFRQAAELATANNATGTRAAQRMLDDLAERGLTVYTDSRGREWDLASYCEMAVRTAASRLSLLTQLQLMGPHAFDLVIVDAPSGELGCRKCAPFEGRVLSLSGRTMNGQLVSVVDASGARKTANVVASLREAVSAGLFHPNCRHDLVPWVDGAAVLPLVGAPRGFVRHGHPIYRVVIPDHDSESYKAQQKQRALERVVRREIAAKSVALTPLAKARANRRLAAARGNLVEHVATHHLTRQRYRENPAKAR